MSFALRVIHCNISLHECLFCTFVYLPTSDRRHRNVKPAKKEWIQFKTNTRTLHDTGRKNLGDMKLIDAFERDKLIYLLKMLINNKSLEMFPI